MLIRSSFVAASAAFVVFLGTAHAQETSMEGQEAGAMPSGQMPEACQTGAAPGMPAMAEMTSDMEGMGEHQRALMEAMMATQMPMIQGVMAEDPDLAFACGMTPHHQGAIGMAEAELEFGDDEQMKELARNIIDDQRREIEELTAWIEEQAQ